MNLDENAAAFGLFELTFANLAERLAAAVFFIRRIKEPNLKFDDVFRLRFSDLREALKYELKKYEGQSLHKMEVQELRELCTKAGVLAKWRNPRVHPRVRIDENGITIYDKRTLQRLTINRDECVEKIREAIAISVNLDINVSTLVRDAESKEEISKMLEDIFNTVEHEAE